MTRRVVIALLVAAVVACAMYCSPVALAGFKGAAAVSWPVWALAAMGLAASYALRATRIHVDWAPSHGVQWRECLYVMLQHNAAVLLLPMRTGEIGFPLLLARRWGVGAAEATASLVALRAQDALVMLLLGLAGAAIAAGANEAVSLAWTFAGVAAAALCFGTILVLAARHSASRAQMASLKAVEATVLTFSPAGPVQSWRRLPSMVISAWLKAPPTVWLLSLANWLVKLSALALLYEAAANLSPITAWMAAMGGEIGAALPVQAPSGFGTYEAGAALLATWTGEPAPLPMLLGTALAVHLSVVAAGLFAGSLALLAHRPDLAKLRHGTSAR